MPSVAANAAVAIFALTYAALGQRHGIVLSLTVATFVWFAITAALRLAEWTPAATLTLKCDRLCFHHPALGALPRRRGAEGRRQADPLRPPAAGSGSRAGRRRGNDGEPLDRLVCLRRVRSVSNRDGKLRSDHASASWVFRYQHGGNTQVPAFMIELRKQQDVPAEALEFCILTAARQGEVLGARWDEISGDTWTVPGERMKSGKPHRVPLSQQAATLLQELPRDGELIFCHPRHPDRRLHHTEPLRVMRRLGRSETVHGMRSAFRDWASERTAFPYEVCERALAHSTGSQAARAYARSDLLEERRRLMEQWATFLNTPPAERGEVIPMRA